MTEQFKKYPLLQKAVNEQEQMRNLFGGSLSSYKVNLISSFVKTNKQRPKKTRPNSFKTPM